MSRQTASCHEIDSGPQKTESEEQKKALQMLTWGFNCRVLSVF